MDPTATDGLGRLRPAGTRLPLFRLVALLEDELEDGSAVEGSSATTVITGIALDSRHVVPGDLFAALRGEYVHGAQFVSDAIAAGAVAVLTDPEGAGMLAKGEGHVETPLLVVSSARSQVGEVAAEIYGRPSDNLLMLAVTGTNGKTTTTWLIEHALRRSGHVTGLVGTVESQIAGAPIPSSRTTPEAPELHALLAVMLERGVTAVAMEVSSHATAMKRIDGCRFDVVGFTQFGVDHLDFHGDIDRYFEAKRALFSLRYSRRAVVCIDSDGGERLAERIRVANDQPVTDALPMVTVATEGKAADWTAEHIKPATRYGYTFDIHTAGGDYPAKVRLPGAFNVANGLLAAVMLHEAGVSTIDAVTAISEFEGVPGRMDAVDLGQPFGAMVDYAHTADALRAVLAPLEAETGGRVLVAFGCGGDRDQGKRPVMGAIAAELADIVIVTDDNPRSEDPKTIRAQILAGAYSVADSRRAELLEVPNRAQAIQRLVQLAAPGDTLVVAGKGHEHGQEVSGTITPFDDRTELRVALQQWLTTAPSKDN